MRPITYLMIFLLPWSLAQAQYLGTEPAVPALLEGIRFCALEPMAGAENHPGLKWFRELKSGGQTCIKNAAAVQDEKGTWVVFENSSQQIRALRVTQAEPLSEVDCQQLKAGSSGPDFSMNGLANAIAQQQKKLLLAAEAARPARTREDYLQFALCHNSLNRLVSEYGLRILSRNESDRLSRVHRPDPAVPDKAGANR